MNWLQREDILLGEGGRRALQETRIFLAGLGGVGSYAFEALLRAGVGSFVLVDADVYEESNLNRQLGALRSTLGHAKVSVSAHRAAEVNPQVRCLPLHERLNEARVAALLAEHHPDFVVDCVDDVKVKLALAQHALRLGCTPVAALAAGNRLSSRYLRRSSLAETSVCPLARRMRHELRKRGLSLDFQVVYSLETGREPALGPDGQHQHGTISYLPAMVGLLLAEAVIEQRLAQVRSC